jgi:prephenate dehydratase
VPPAASAPPGRYGFLGPEGSFAHAAALQLADAIGSLGSVGLAGYASVAEAVDAVRDGTVAGAVVPLENSVEGAVPATLDELAGGPPLVIAAESYLPVVFDLLARPGTRPQGIGTVATHPPPPAGPARSPRATTTRRSHRQLPARATASTASPTTSPTTPGR